MHKTMIAVGLGALFAACSTEPAEPGGNTPNATQPAGNAQVALTLDSVP